MKPASNLNEQQKHKEVSLCINSHSSFKDTVQLATLACDIPIACILLTNTQELCSGIGINNNDLKNNQSFYKYLSQHRQLFVTDSTTLANYHNQIQFCAGIPIFSPNDTIFGILCIMDRKQRSPLTLKQREILKLLSQQVTAKLEAAEKTAELSKSKEVAEKASLAKSEFLSIMSHEIRTPLNGVVGMTDLLIEDSPRPKQYERLQTLKFSAKNLMSIINDILDFSKIEAGKVDFEDIDFSPKTMLKSIKACLTHRAENKGIRLKLMLDSRIPPMIVGDPTRLSQVLNNLVGNAIKFTTKGSVNIEAFLLDQDTANNKVTLKIAVKDTGIGIPKDKIKAIFEQFSQADVSVNRKFGGTGLGLAITKRLLELQGSQIQVSSTVGKGSTFYFEQTFEISDKEVDEQKQQDRAEAMPDFSQYNDAKILIVEDNNINIVVAKSFLGRWNFELDVAKNGSIAVQKVQEKDYDLVLMDLQMPVMDGFTATRTIRNLPDAKYKKLPIVALTASATLEIEDRVYSVGMNDFVQKPFNPNNLYQKIAKHLKSKKTLVSSKKNDLDSPLPVAIN